MVSMIRQWKLFRERSGKFFSNIVIMKKPVVSGLFLLGEIRYAPTGRGKLLTRRGRRDAD